MPRESVFRRLPVPSSARRRLFGEVDHEALGRRLQSQLDAEMDEQSKRWGFDFRNDVPLHDNNNNPSSSTHPSSSSTSSNFIYETLNAAEVSVYIHIHIYASSNSYTLLQVPVVYRPNEIIRTEIPNVGMVEIKTFPSGIGPIETPPVEHVVPEPHVPNPRKRHLPTPLKSPMKLRKRASPHKTPINLGPKPSEHSHSGFLCFTDSISDMEYIKKLWF